MRPSSRDTLNFLAAVTAFAAGGACFAVNRTLLRGWGHSLFHCFLCVYVYHALSSAHALAVGLHRAEVAGLVARALDAGVLPPGAEAEPRWS